jgi:hypothetical protein
MTVKDAIFFLEQLPQDLEIQHFYDSGIRGRFNGFAYVADNNPNTNQPEYSVIPIDDEYLHDLRNDNRYTIMDTIYCKNETR